MDPIDGLIFVVEFYQRPNKYLELLGRNSGQFLLSGLWVPHILHLLNFFQFHTTNVQVINGF